MNRKTIVITGASGFLGSHLVNRIKDDNQYSIYALSSKPVELKEKIGGKNVSYHYKDALDAEILKNSVVINCAYPRNAIGTAIADGLKYIQRVFEASAEYCAAEIINISSQSVYSQQRTEIATEETPICLEGPYAVGKYATELMLESICNGREVSHTSLRMASLIGPGFDQRIVNRFAMRLLKGDAVKVVQQPKRMGFLDVEDAVSAILAVASIRPASVQPVYNVGNGKGYTVEEIYNIVSSVLGDQIHIPQPFYEIGTDTSSTAVSYERLCKDTGFNPSIDLTESVKRIIARM